MIEWSTPNHHSASAGRDRDDDAREHLHAHEALDLQVDVVEDLHGDLLLRERRPGNLDELAFVEIAGDEKEVDEEQHQHELSREAEQPDAARPEVVGRPERRLHDFDFLNAGRSCAWPRSARRVGAAASCAAWSISVAACCTFSSAPPGWRRCVRTRSRIRCAACRNVADDGHRLIAERVDAEPERRRPAA